jgi:hypothetical protein
MAGGLKARFNRGRRSLPCGLVFLEEQTRRKPLMICVVLILWTSTLPAGADTVVQLFSPTEFNYPATTIDFDDGSDRTVANTRYLGQGVEFSRDDGREVVLLDWQAAGKVTTSPPSILATVKYPAPTWVTHLNATFSDPIFELGAFFGNDDQGYEFTRMTLSAFDEKGSLLGSVTLNTNNNNLTVDQFIGLRSNVPIYSARFEQNGEDWAVCIDDMSFTDFETMTYYVDSDANGADDGSSWQDAFNYLQDALAAASNGDEILVAEGVYTPDSNSAYPDGTGDRRATFQLVKGVAVRGGYAGVDGPDLNTRDIDLYETILSGDLKGDDDPDFANNSDNSYNVVRSGSKDDFKAVLDGFIISGANSEPGEGSVACVGEGSSGTIRNCIIRSNFGIGVKFDESTATVRNCIIAGNGDVGIYALGRKSGIIQNCTIVRNAGGGIYAYRGRLTITNSIVWDNLLQEIVGRASATYSNVRGGWEGNGNIGSDPCFVNAFGGDYHLGGDSPCINAGDPNYVAGANETDLEGKPRVIGGRVDMGAYEFNHLPVACIVGGDGVVEADSNCEERVVLDGSCSSDADSTEGTNDDINDFDWYEVIDACEPNSDIYMGSGEVIECNLGVGEHLIVLEVTDKAGAFDSNEVVITVVDVTPPEFSLVVEPNILWPANGKMVLVRPEWEVSDNCDEEVEVSLVDITMSTAGDINDYVEIRGDGSIYLRAKKGKGGSGRIYTLTYDALDDAGNAAEASVTVTVPRSRRQRRLGRGLVRRQGRQVYRRGVRRR